MIRVEGLDLGYEDRPVLAGLNFQVDRGEFVGILGPNGSGKSTLLHALSGLLPPQQGRIVIKSEALGGLPSRLRAQILAVVPQTTDVRFPFTCLEIVLMGRYPHRRRLGTLTDADLVWALKSMRRTTTDAPQGTAHHRGLRGGMPAGGDRPGPGPGPGNPAPG